MDYFRNSMGPVEKALRDSGLDKKAIHDIVLVGGSTRIPKVHSPAFYESQHGSVLRMFDLSLRLLNDWREKSDGETWKFGPHRHASLVR